MYIPSTFRNDNSLAVFDFIKENGFAILVSTEAGRPLATHIPMVLATKTDGTNVLQGHISKANPQWKQFANSSEVLAIFSGPHAYISSSWYNHPNVPTWNYEAVHVYGNISIIDGVAVEQSLKALVDKYESTSACPFKMENLDATYLQQHIAGIVAFEITITEVQAAAKLSQNRDDINHEQIVSELRQRNGLGDGAVAEAMSNERKNSKL